MKPEIQMKTPQLVELVEVIHVEDARGSGTEKDPVRIIHQYWSKKGELLAEKEN